MSTARLFLLASSGSKRYFSLMLVNEHQLPSLKPPLPELQKNVQQTLSANCSKKEFQILKAPMVSKRSKESKHDIASYITAISECGSNQHRALKIFETMTDWKIRPNRNAFNALINVLCKARNLSLCWDWFNKMRFEHNIEPNHETYHILFGAMLKLKQYSDIIQEFEDISQKYRNSDTESEGLLVTIYRILPITLISYGKLVRVDCAKRLFYEYMDKYNDANICFDNKQKQNLLNAMINAIVSVLTVSNRIDESIELLAKISQNIFYNDNRAYLSMLKSVNRMKPNSGFAALAPIYNMALSECPKDKLSVDVFNVMMSHCNDSKEYLQTIKIWNDMTANNVRPDSISFIEYLQCLIYSLHFEQIGPLIEAIMSECRNNKKIATPLLIKCAMWSSIETIRNSDHCPLSPLSIYEICKNEFNILPDIDIMNEVLFFCLRTSFNYREALLYLDEMRRWNLKLNTKTFNIFISGMGKLNRMDLIKELLVEMERCECPKNGATFMNLLDAAAQNGQIEECKQYLHEFEEECGKSQSNDDMAMYADRKCYGHLINCYANFFAKQEQNDDIAMLFTECLEQWNALKQNNLGTLSIADYILMLKCIKNYVTHLDAFNNLNEQIDEIQTLAMNLFENVQNNESELILSHSNMRTAFNLFLDILYKTNDIELGTMYMDKAEAMNIYTTLKEFDSENGVYSVDLHQMTRYPAIFAVLNYLNKLQQKHATSDIDKWNESEFEIITGIGMTSTEWTPILKPIILNLLDNGLKHPISYHLPSYNEGVIILDNSALRKYFTNS